MPLNEHGDGKKSQEEMIIGGLGICYRTLQSNDKKPITKIMLSIISDDDKREPVSEFGIDPTSLDSGFFNITHVVIGFCRQGQIPIHGLDIHSVRDDCLGYHGHYIRFEYPI